MKYLPLLKEFGFSEKEIRDKFKKDERSYFKFNGGES